MPLNDSAIKAAKPGEKPKKLADEKGLFLLLKPTGAKLWRVKYRFAGREQLLSLGAYPETSLKQARERRDDIRKQAAAGIDPSADHGESSADKVKYFIDSFDMFSCFYGGRHPPSMEALFNAFADCLEKDKNPQSTIANRLSRKRDADPLRDFHVGAVRNVCRAASIAVLDLLEQFAASGIRSDKLHDGTRHEVCIHP